MHVNNVAVKVYHTGTYFEAKCDLVNATVLKACMSSSKLLRLAAANTAA